MSAALSQDTRCAHVNSYSYTSPKTDVHRQATRQHALCLVTWAQLPSASYTPTPIGVRFLSGEPLVLQVELEDTVAPYSRVKARLSMCGSGGTYPNFKVVLLVVRLGAGVGAAVWAG